MWAVLETRSRAVLSADRPAFEATVAPGAGAAYQQFWYAQSVRAHLAGLSYELSTPDLAESHGDTYVTLVDEHVRVGDIDPGDVTIEHHLTFRRTAGRWRVARDTWDTSQVIAAPWELRGTRVTSRPGLLLVTEGLGEEEDGRLADDAVGAVRTIERELPGRLPGAIVVALRDDTTPFSAEGIDTRELSLLGGLTVPMDWASTDIDSARVIVPPSSLTAPRGWRREMLRHELTHVALTEDSVYPPVWATEGAAEYYAHRPEWGPTISNVAFEAARRGIRDLPQDAYFHDDRESDWDRNYDISWYAMEWIAEQKGPAEPARLLDAFEQGKVRFDADVDALLRKRYGVDRAGLARKAGALILRDYS